MRDSPRFFKLARRANWRPCRRRTRRAARRSRSCGGVGRGAGRRRRIARRCAVGAAFADGWRGVRASRRGVGARLGLGDVGFRHAPASACFAGIARRLRHGGRGRATVSGSALWRASARAARSAVGLRRGSSAAGALAVAFAAPPPLALVVQPIDELAVVDRRNLHRDVLAERLRLAFEQHRHDDGDREREHDRAHEAAPRAPPQFVDVDVRRFGHRYARLRRSPPLRRPRRAPQRR